MINGFSRVFGMAIFFAFLFFACALLMMSDTAADYLTGHLGFNSYADEREGRGEAVPSSFKIFDGTLYKGKPASENLKFPTIKIIYEAELWGGSKNHTDVPSEFLIKTAASRARGHAQVVINIEHWPLVNSTHEVDTEGLNKYLKVLASFKKFQPTARFGYYARPPMPDYWRAIDASAKQRKIDWQRDNDALVGLAQAVDVFYPSLYAYYTDQSGWVKYAEAQIREARRLAKGKPVYPFIWPQYHDSNRLIGCQFISDEFWALQLETVARLADGVIIWGGWDVCRKADGRALMWDEHAGWWGVTKAFIQKYHLNTGIGQVP